MQTDEVEALTREERLIAAWIRDVTATKQGRLQEIRAKLRVLSGEKSGNTKGRNPAQAVTRKKVVHKLTG